MQKRIQRIGIISLIFFLLLTSSCQNMAEDIAQYIVESNQKNVDSPEIEELKETVSNEGMEDQEIQEEIEGLDVYEGNTEDRNIEEPIEETKKITVSGEKRIVCYYTSWSAYARNVLLRDIDFDKITHLNFAFANLSEDGSLVIGDSWVDVEKPMEGDGGWTTDGLRGHFRQMQLLKELYPDLKTLISVGGWTWSKNFSDVAASPVKRQNFARSAVQFVTEYGFDGVDIDWEFPVEGGENIPHLEEDKENYTLLVKEIREAFDQLEKKDGRHYLLTIAAGPNPSFAENTEFKKLTEYLDFVNIMSYDYHGGWENVTGHNAPLYSTEGLSVDDVLQAYLDTGVDPLKLNLGLAFYGRGWSEVTDQTNHGLGNAGVKPGGTGHGSGTWEGGVFDYWDLKKNYINKDGYVRYFDSNSYVPYLYNGNSFITYDDEESIGIKVDYALAKGLGGVMYWEFSGDKDMVLLDTVVEHLSKVENGEVKEITLPKKPEKKSPSEEDSINLENSSIPNWSSETVYNGGEEVYYEGHVYQAKWWTQNEKPGSKLEEGAWKKVR